MEGIDSSVSAYSIELTWGGKLPSVGDFIWNSGHTPLRARLDNWLLTGMQQLHSMLSDSWQSGFDQAPMWNFIVPASMLGSGCVAGCISPSCDRTGRRFPFVVTYGLSAQIPASSLSQAVNAIVPGLLSQTGVLLFNGIRRQWPRETLAALLQQTLANWEPLLLLPPVEQTDLGAQYDDSVILDVLKVANDDNDDPALPPTPDDRFSTLPWSNVAHSLNAGAATSFWWTNGVGGAAMKAFTYGDHLDGALMTWLFGSSPR